MAEPESARELSTLADWVSRLELEHEANKKDRSFGEIRTFARKLGLTNIGARTVVVGGTNGKGSVVHLVEQALIAEGLKVGSTTSPHLSRINERIKLCGDEISDDLFISYLREILTHEDKPPTTYFDVVTLASLMAFRDHSVDVALLEVGLGGRLDPCNVVDPAVSVITNVSLDHQDVLGYSRESIGREKAGILRQGVPFVSGEVQLPKSVLQVADNLECPIYQPFGQGSGDCKALECNKMKTPRLDSERNLAVAREVLKLIGGQTSDSFSNLSSIASLPGRLELIQRNGQNWVLDVAHNLASIDNLKRYLADSFSNAKVLALFTCLRDKNFNELARVVQGFADQMIVTDSYGPRGFIPDCSILSLSDSGVEYIPDFHEAFRKFQTLADPASVHVVCGSFQLVGKVRELLLNYK
ncbi:MAG: Mur ligase family protein [Gammaproteobacteria bacterium]|nr:Mur ligase family protein [Gammaproteobacteria bacterium]